MTILLPVIYIISQTWYDSQQLKRKSGTDDNEVHSIDWTSSPGCNSVVNSPLKTPVSAKGGRIYNRSQAPKGNRSGPQTPVSNAGETFLTPSPMLN